ncbi:nuclear transport factor 2 family protein [Pseudoduganella chitinolytica]|uniref:Nuclear transport factor 2 family protein n=1 Tax=Pseudoduganella chitinolytica TaxID=34070 RepID=A0ABY8BI47_9BURK|nr:nuclear transport factor 2 family protein [Pseudoduganella chitinolytica]WEF34618.1 nuclear transport factor 2 family protein [Pseudoduganella chitinolytica]
MALPSALPSLSSRAARCTAVLLAVALCTGASRLVRPPVQDAPMAHGPNQAGPNAAALDAVWAAEQEWLLSMRRGDTTALRRILSSDHIHVGTNGRLRHKSELLLALQRRQVRFLTYDVTSYDIRITGTAAIVSGTYHTQLERQGVREISQGRYLRVWLRDDGGWRLMAHQLTAGLVPRGRP